MIVKFTTVIHAFRKEHGLSNNDYVLADIIDFMSSSRKYGRGSYVALSRDELAKEFGISKRGILYMIDRLIEKGLVEKEENTGKVRSTEKWQELREYSPDEAVQKVHHNNDALVQKVHRFGAKSAPQHLYIYRIKETMCEFSSKDEIFDSFWSMYGKPNEKARARKKFLKIAEKNYQKIFDSLPAYIESTPDIKYRKNAVTWLNGECWLDEIETYKSTLKPSNGQIVMPLENNTW